MSKRIRICFLISVCGSLIGGLSLAQESQESALEVDWVQGPSSSQLGSVARIDVPEGYVFAGGEDTQELMEMMENPLSGNEVGFLAPEERHWFIVFEFEGIGYVEDDEKETLDADGILDSLRKGNDAANEIRRKNGWGTMEIVGWQQPPHYNEQTHNLEWATLARTESGETVINHNTRLLGRDGVMSATLVSDPGLIAEVLPVSSSLLARYEFLPGSRYSEFKAGDKIAEYGLTALITGGAAAVAIKSGLLQKFGKFIVLAVVALAASLRKVIAALFGRQAPE
jgi:uncharacterized membrane-anchored protein